MGNFTLGLDLGVNSIGWALIDHDGDQHPQKLIACGSRIFQESVEPKTGAPKNQARRAARAARKLVARRKQRRAKLLNLLVRHGLLPADEPARNALLLDNQANNPYQLRKRGVEEKLDLVAFGRVLYHLAHRRGFQSNRKAASDDEGKVKSAIAALRGEMNGRTLGAFLADQPTQRRRYTDRAMYAEEFEALWEAQQPHYADTLTRPLKVEIHQAIFFQRPLRTQRYLVGKCPCEPTRKRAAKATLLAQRLRILEEVNHLAVKNPVTRDYRPLTQAERSDLADALDRQKSMTWGAVRKVLGWNKPGARHDGETFNLEETKRERLTGNRTACDLRNALGARWESMTEDQRDELVTDLLTIEHADGFLRRMKEHWQFDDATAEALAGIELEPGHARISLKTMRAIQPYLERGMKFRDACKAAGYSQGGPNPKAAADKLGAPPDVRHPVVQKALFEARKVVNAIVREYGKPAIIRVEMARDMKLSRRQKETLQKEQARQKKTNEEAAAVLRRDLRIPQPTRADIQKYAMWLECRGICPYTGAAIPAKMLFSSDVEVAHILPYSRSLDDSYMNKTLCMSGYRRQVKGSSTPYEIGKADPVEYATMLQRVAVLPLPKRRRFEQKQVDTGAFIWRQLNDTRHICVDVRNFLQQLGVPVEIGKGEATAALRQRWRLNGILSADGSDEKNRADHRRHAIDAIVIALAGRALFLELSRLADVHGGSLAEGGFDLPQPWAGFQDHVREKMDAMIVSHAPARKISGALHKETAYGYSENEKVFVTRKALDQKRMNRLTESEVRKIRDAKVRALVEAHIAQHGKDFKTAMAQPLYHADGKTEIKSVRVVSNINKDSAHALKRHGKDYKFFAYGNNHHVEIVEHHETGMRRGRFITAMEAARRARIEKTDIIQRDHGPTWKFVASFSINDILKMSANGSETLYRIQAISEGSQFEITLKRLHDALSEKNENTLRVRSEAALRQIVQKLTVDPLGRLAPSND